MLTKLLRASALLIAGFAIAGAAAGADVTVRPAKGSFDDVKERVMLAIGDQGLVLNYTAYVGNMLERTGKDIGRERRIYDRAEVLEFCSASVSRSTMEADPRNIAYCPYAIAVYTLADDADKVYIAYRKPPPTAPALRKVGQLLDGIVRDALK